MQEPRTSAQAENAGRTQSFGADEFCAQYKASFRVLWLIAVGTVGDAASADDVVQDAAMVALGKLDDFEPGTNFTAWMGRMVRFVGLNHARKERKHRATAYDASGDDLDMMAAQPAPDDSADAFDRRLVRELDDVADVARACLLLRTVEGLPYTQIAELLDIPQGTAMSHVHRTRRLLRERLAPFWSGQSTSGEPAA